MVFLTLFAALHQMLGDLLAISAVVGTFIMMLSPFSDVDWQTKKWAIGGFVAGVLGQISMALLGSTSEKIGIFFRLAPENVTTLLAISFCFLVIRGWLRSHRYEYM